jgi:hypothetical protein
MFQHVVYPVYAAARDLSYFVLRDLRKTELENQKVSQQFGRLFFRGNGILFRQVNSSVRLMLQILPEYITCSPDHERAMHFGMLFRRSRTVFRTGLVKA